MWKIGRIIFLIYLGILAVLDMRSRKIPVRLLLFGGIGTAVYQCFQRIIPWELCLSGAAIGGVFLLISKVTREEFGYGDSLLILILGISIGVWNLVSVLVISFSLSAIVSAGALVIGKFQRKTAVPFIPFLVTGYFCVRILGGGG